MSTNLESRCVVCDQLTHDTLICGGCYKCPKCRKCDGESCTGSDEPLTNDETIETSEVVDDEALKESPE